MRSSLPGTSTPPPAAEPTPNAPSSSASTASHDQTGRPGQTPGPWLNGQYAILEFPDASDSSVVYIEGVTSDLYLEKPADVQKYSVMYEHLRAQALNVEQSRQLIGEIAKEYARLRPE
nr:Scr1 family TA system antitoxin-like transcriptional regulator [Streptomyces sp. LBUM 1482]